MKMATTSPLPEAHLQTPCKRRLLWFEHANAHRKKRTQHQCDAKADKSVPESFVISKASIDLSEYNTDKVAVFSAALDHATSVLANQELSDQDQALVDEAVNNLKEAIAALLNTAGADTAVNGGPAATTGAGSDKTSDAVPIGMAVAALLLADNCFQVKKSSHCSDSEIKQK